MKTNRINLVSIKSLLVTTLLGAVALVSATSSFAGAVAVDSLRAEAWGVARADEGTPSRQLELAIERSRRFGGTPGYIRAYQFNVPQGWYAALAIGYVPGKGWAGNYGYAQTVAQAEENARAGMRRQGVPCPTVVKTWRE